MKKIVAVIISLLFIMLTFASCSSYGGYDSVPVSASDEVGVVSFNVAAPWGSITNNTLSSSRVKRFAKYMNSIKPDFIGTQEMNEKWMEELSELMPDYDSYGVKRGGDENENKSEMNSIFWLRDKYSLIAEDTFWLTQTPQSESKFDGAGCNRICTYVILENNETGEAYIHFNTHLDNASEEAAAFGANVIKEQIVLTAEKYPDATIILTGDFNETEGMKAYNTASEVLNNSSKIAKDTVKFGGTYQGWSNDAGDLPIDFIFTNSDTVSLYEVLNDTSNGCISDHYGIFASIK